MVQKVLSHRERPIPSLQAVRSDVPEGLDVVFRRMIAKKPQDRQQSMTQVIANLQACGASVGQRSEGPPGAAATIAAPAGVSRLASAASASPAPIPSLIDEWLVEEPAVLSERWLPPTWRTIQHRARRRRLWVWGGVLASLLLTWLIVDSSLLSPNSNRTPPPSSEASLVVTVNQPDALIQVVDGQDKVVASRKSGQETVRLGVDPGEYRLRVEKAGFRASVQTFTIERGQSLELKAALCAAG